MITRVGKNQNQSVTVDMQLISWNQIELALTQLLQNVKMETQVHQFNLWKEQPIELSSLTIYHKAWAQHKRGYIPDLRHISEYSANITTKIACL